MRMADLRTFQFEFQQEQLVSLDKAPAALVVAASALTLVLGTLSLGSNSPDVAGAPALLLVALSLAFLLVANYRATRRWDREGIVLLSLSLVAALFLLAMPEWFYGYELNAIIHRSFFTVVLLLGLGTASLSYSTYHLLGATPTARDVSRYPIILLPVALAVVAYTMILWKVFEDGISGFELDALTTAYSPSATDIDEPGMRNHILGTLLLVGMTLAIATPIGIGAGVYRSEYPGWTARLIGFSSTMLRAMSVMIIGVVAFSLVQGVDGRAAGDPLSDLIRGYFHDEQGFIRFGRGSFLLAATFIAMLVIPVIARATEEGLQSVPKEVREGSMALGATPGHNLVNILFPWAFPVVLTGILVAAAESAGSTAVLLFIAGTGEHGVGPLNEVTSLDAMIFHTRYGSTDGFQEVMRQYQFTAALLLLLLTLGLTCTALYVKARARRRYQGFYAS